MADIVSSTTMSSGIKTLYEKRLLSRALPRLLHARWGMHANLSRWGDYELRKEFAPFV